jgi:hypothetical protein
MEQAHPIYFDGSKQEELKTSAKQDIQMDESVRGVISCNPFPYIEISKQGE